MSDTHQLDTFRSVWNAEAERTVQVLSALPDGQYDFRPDPDGRSIGEMAWHLSEIDACLSYGIVLGRFRFEDEPPNLKRPRELAALAPGYQRIHQEAVSRLDGLADVDLDRTAQYFDGRTVTYREILWNELLHHLIHHRAQLMLLVRMAGGTPPGLYGPNREEMKAIMARMKG